MKMDFFARKERGGGDRVDEGFLSGTPLFKDMDRKDVQDMLACLGSYTKTYEKVKDAPSAIDILTAVSFPAAAFQDNSGYCYYTSCFTVIPDDILSHQMLLRGIVYSVYLDYTTRSHLYSVYCSKLQSYLGPTDPQSEKDDWRQMWFFAYKLKKYNYRFSPVILDQYIHR